MGDIVNDLTHISDHLATTWSSKSQSCLGRLPDETWGECFLWLYVQDLCAVSQTCRRLRMITLASSRLWATATISSYTSLYTATVRSRKAPLHLQLGRDFVPSDGALRLCASRLREVCLVLRWNRMVDWSVFLHVPMPMLDILRVRPGVFDTYETPIIPLYWGQDSVPRLRVLQVPSILLADTVLPSSSHHHGPFPRLEELNVSLVHDDDLAILLRQSPNLRLLRATFRKNIPNIPRIAIPVNLQQVSLHCLNGETGRAVSFLPVADWPLPSMSSLSLTSSFILAPLLDLPWDIFKGNQALSLDVRWPWNGEAQYGNSAVALARDDTSEHHTVYLQCATTPGTSGPDLNALTRAGFAARFTSMNIDPRILVQLVRMGASLPEVTSLAITIHPNCILDSDMQLRIYKDLMFVQLLGEGTKDASGRLTTSMLHLLRLAQIAVTFTGPFPEFLSLEAIDRGRGFIEEVLPAVLDERIELTNGLEYLEINLPAQLCESPAHLCNIYYALQGNAVHHIEVYAYDSGTVEMDGGEWKNPYSAIPEELEFIPALRD